MSKTNYAKNDILLVWESKYGQVGQTLIDGNYVGNKIR